MRKEDIVELSDHENKAPRIFHRSEDFPDRENLGDRDRVLLHSRLPRPVKNEERFPDRDHILEELRNVPEERRVRIRESDLVEILPALELELQDFFAFSRPSSSSSLVKLSMSIAIAPM